MTLIGHASAVAALRDAASGDRIHHAWLLAGPKGIGKATFATAAARWLLAREAGPAFESDGLDVPAAHPIGSLLDAGSHPDFRVLARLPKDRSEELARSIAVDQVRALQPLFATTPSLSRRRVVVIDAIDDLERNAANALLKNLEEPPRGTIFLLVSHAPGRLLPTIRSRCRLLRFGALDAPEVAAVLRTVLPDADSGEITDLVGVAGGAPGTALGFTGLDIAGLDAAIDRLAREGDPGNALRAQLGRALATKAAQGRYEAFLERAPSRIAAAARTAPPARLGELTALWRQAREIGDRAVRQSADPQTTVFELAGLVAALAHKSAHAKA
ncbi:AAA family ATPase [Sphingomonas nostoxanthinifaciens]|uniref:AAA family ATPase n=1 Tax=Sphingomonas nostoxanthinifaciens TaxID=2872652 RepID=UPI001CC1CC93|nr:AAA family ATPase [Sphingomonas nostoxanthinifaciens]UAK22841.1 AAA family ATPase [Sphingomonas nostoxanthinifaciens]